MEWGVERKREGVEKERGRDFGKEREFSFISSPSHATKRTNKNIKTIISEEVQGPLWNAVDSAVR